MEILLNSLKNINSVNLDNIRKIELSTKMSYLTEYDVKNTLSQNDVFDDEREKNNTYRIYGKFEYMSLLNGLAFEYAGIINYFYNPLVDDGNNCRNIFNSFQVSLVAPLYQTNIHNSTGGSSNRYFRTFEVLSNGVEIFDAGFSNNVYGEQTYNFCIDDDIDISNYFDSFGFPLTELFLYFKPVRFFDNSIQFNPNSEKLDQYSWNSSNSPTKIPVDAYYYGISVGGHIYGDIIEYNKENFQQTVLSGQSYFMSIPDFQNGIPNYNIFKFNPFVPIRLRYFSSEISTGNKNTTSYELLQSIPNYATEIGGNNFVWREILPQGYNDPLTNIGIDNPFVNKKTYVFNNFIFDVAPDMSDQHTRNTFMNTVYNEADIVNLSPNTNIDEIGKPC